MNEPLAPSVDLSIILINWNSLEVTSEALSSLREHTEGIRYEVFVVDNGSTKDRSVEELPKRFPWARFIANPANLGFTKANNMALRLATGRYQLLLNNDTVQTGNALAEAVRYMDLRPRIGALGILHLNRDEDRTAQPSAFSFPRPIVEGIDLLSFQDRPVGGKDNHAHPPSEKDVDWVCGSFLLMRRECLEAVGLLDERFFIYDEDIDWGRRARDAGWLVRFWAGVSMIHLGAASNPLMKDKTFVMFRSHLSYIHKHHSLQVATLYYVAMCMRLTLATLKQTLRLITGRTDWKTVRQRWHRQAQFMLLRSGHTGG